jgi:hypothetical protein
MDPLPPEPGHGSLSTEIETGRFTGRILRQLEDRPEEGRKDIKDTRDLKDNNSDVLVVLGVL